MTPTQQIDVIGKAFVDGLKAILGEKLYGAYIYGAAAFPDAVPTKDIDFHVILRSSLTPTEKSQLEQFHEFLGQKFPPLGGEFDGYYILLEDAVGRTPPKSQMWNLATDNSWALHREHILAGRHIILYGPEPKDIYLPAAWSEVESALYGELDYIEKHLQEYPDYCILNLCRLIYSFETRDVVISKAQASEWARNALPQWREHVDAARKSYACQATPEDGRFLCDEVGKFFEFAKGCIEQASKKGI
jgi:hypothetical protein